MRLNVSSKRVRVSLLDLAHRLFERVERGGDVGELPVEVFLALAGLLELVDGGQVHLAQLLEVDARRVQRFFPGRDRGVRGETGEDLGELETRGGELLRQALAAHARFLRGHARLFDTGARLVDARLGIHAFLVELAQTHRPLPRARGAPWTARFRRRCGAPGSP
jgi:hypothetical protein